MTNTAEPGQIIFDKILKNNIRFSSEDAETFYSDIYEHMPSEKKKKWAYQNQNWYSIYHQYKTIEMVSVTAKEFRLCRDMFISTINTFLIYAVLCFITDEVTFDWCYTGFLCAMLVISNIAARKKGENGYIMQLLTIFLRTKSDKRAERRMLRKAYNYLYSYMLSQAIQLWMKMGCKIKK